MTSLPEAFHPFLWIKDIDDVNINYLDEVAETVRRKLTELINLEFGYDEDKIIYNLFLALHASEQSNYRKGLNFLEDLEPLSESHKFYKVYDHAVKSSEGYLLKRIDEGGPSAEGHSDENRGKNIPDDHLLYVKAKFFAIFNHQGNNLVLELLEKAISTNPIEGCYHFTLGNVLSRERHSVFPFIAPGVKEMHHMKQATQLAPSNVVYRIMLARTYSDCARFTPKNNTGRGCNKNYAKSYQELSASILKSILISDYDRLNGKLIARCVHLLRTNPSFKGNVIFTLENFASDALKKAPDSPMVNHYIGMYYISQKNFRSALPCYEKAIGSIPFLMGPVLAMRKNYLKVMDNEEFIKNTLAGCKNEVKNCLDQALIGVSEYYLLVENDLSRACEYYLKIDKLSDELSKTKVSILAYPHNRLIYKRVLKTAIREFIEKDTSEESKQKNPSAFSLWIKLKDIPSEKFKLEVLRKSLLY